MGRSKFPGKPPKTVTRKRIKVLGRPEANQSDSVTVAENIYYGLSLFNVTFGGNEKEHPPFHGFSSNEAKLSVSYVKTQQRDGGSTEKAAPASTEAIPKSGDGNEGVNGGQTSSAGVENLEESSEDKNIEEKPLKAREEATINAQEAMLKNSKGTEKSVKVENVVKAPLKSVNNILDRHQRTRQLRNSTAKRLLQRAKTSNSNARNMSIQCGDKANGNVRKFVLPVRSAHSSRVIKPNKRFIEELEESLYPEQCENEGGKHSKKARIAPGKSEEAVKATKEATSLVQSQAHEKEAKKSKKAAHCATSNSESLDQISGNDSNSFNLDAQTSKEPRGDLKKCQNKLTSRTSCNPTSVVQESIQRSAPTASSGGKNAAEILRFADKQISVPTKVLPDSNVPNVESSRVQTRSGTLSEASSDTNSQVKPETPRELDESQEKGDGDLGVKLNDKTIVAIKETEGSREEAEIKNKCSDESESESTLSESGSENDDHSEDEQSEWTGMKLNGGKVILRKARLKLDNKTLSGTEGPFSTTNSHINAIGNSNPGPTATVKCGVCGAVRFYRFVKQARKFGIHSCESCRKFISKMIKRQACAKSANSTLPILQCHKGDGLCLVPPVVRSQQWNLMRCVYKARCPACWLKMCLKCYNIPSALRTGLNSLLPPLMRDSVISLSLGQDESDALCHNKSGSKISWPAEDCSEKNLFKSAMSWSSMEIGRKLAYHSNAGGLLSKKLEKSDYPISMSPSKKRKNDNRIKVRKKMKNPLLLSTTSHCPPPPRQRIDLKGPRVKHVCRSASVALGQPLATFPSSDGKDGDGDATKNVAKAPRSDEKSEKKGEPPKDKENNSQKSNQESSCTSSSNSSNGIQTSCAKRTKSQQNVLAPNHQVVRSLPKPRIDAIHTISIDFWEQYDPAEVGAKGFALIGSELFHIPAVCFLCGSGGKEPLIHCQCCCEPYHAFCLEPSEWNACALPNWCCPRCTICQTCRLRSGPKLSCIRCRQSFHHSCLSKSGVSARLYSPDRPYVCQSCIKCKSCGSEGVNVHVGNLPLCSMCFKLRQRGNYCPLCQRFYNENDFDTKMMECNECSCWVHARCEGLSDESYEILSYLPDSIEFTCSQCSPRPDSLWRSAIDSELRAGFISVIKALSKNRKACAALKWSPRKECLCKSSVSARRLEFSDSERYVNCDESEDCYSDKSTDATSNSTSVDSKSDSSSRTAIDFDSENKRVDVPRRGLRRLRQKFRLKECTLRVKNCKSNSGQDGSSQEYSSDGRECQCSEQQIIARPAPSLMSIKRKVNSNEYNSLVQFYCDMEQVVNRIDDQDLLDAYHNSLHEIFPWFDPKSSKITVDGSSTPTSEKSKMQDVSPAKLDDSIIERWKEEVLKAPKAIAAKTGNLYSNVHSEDSRICCLCKGLGDGQETKEGRLLYCGQNEWIHSNCALWSNEVFEEIDGSLQNVHSAISRGRLIRCTECGKKGASVGCCSKNCNNTFHYPCARSVGLAFNDDKTVFCILHLANCQSKTIQNEADFDLRRAIYVELDRKKKKYVEPDKVKVMIGSLTVDCLGSVVPEFSDTNDKILPANYKCSRLYWSTVNPMKIVRYYIRTYVQMYVPESRVDVENNVTIDHSKEREKEEARMDRQKLEQLVVKQTLEALIDSVCNREVDENLAEQNNTDLLPPEIKDAIFEDLPHDLLDGISMQDIFPKMTYEDFLAMDLKTDGVFGPDLLKDEILPSEVDEIMKPPESKISKVDSQCIAENVAQNDFWLHLEAKGSVHDLMDDLFNSKGQKLGGRELKRSKSEVMTNNPLMVGGQRHHQRSCSLTWSCKLDGTYGPTMKRRKLPRPPATARSAEANVMLVDSQNVERGSLFHELRIPESIMVTVGRANTPSILSESVRELKYCIDEAPGMNRRVISPRDDSKDHKRLLWQHTRQQPRMLQVDGPADPSSASECSSPEYNIEERLASIRTAESIPQVDGTNDESCCDTDWFSYKNRYRSFSTASTSSFDESPESLRNFSDSEKPPNLERSFLEDQDSNEGLRIPQLDGADDISSDEDSISPRIIEDDTSVPTYVPVSELSDRPVTCKRCKCTYRTRDSYDRHLSNCDLITTSDSDSETMDNKGASPDSRFSPSIGSMSPQFATMSPSEGHTLSSEYPDTQVSSPLEASVASPHPAMQVEPIAQALITPQIHTHSTVETVHQTVLTSNDVIVQTQYTRTTTTLPNPSAVLPQESTVEITEIANSPSPQPSEPNIQESSNLAVSAPSVSVPQVVQSPRVSSNFSSTVAQTPTVESAPPGNFQAARVKPKSPRAPRSRAKVVKSSIVRNSMPQQHTNQMRYQPMQTSTPVLQLQQQRPTTCPTMILQQVHTPGIMSAYVETLQQQSGQNLQYITTLGAQQEPTYKPQFIATNQLVPGAYIQAASDNLLALQNGGISVLPSVQIAQPQPTVLGTIIQQQPNAIQCGVISSEQLVLSSAPTLEMFSDSTGSMFVTSQPMYYGLETIVSNTVMSSSQFMTGAVPQVLASSYQTTTQVFQASKLMEPMVDVQTVSSIPNVPAVQAVQGVPTVHGGYVVVNQTPPAPEPLPRPPPQTHRVQPPPPPPPPPPQISSPLDTFVTRNCEPITLTTCQPNVEPRTHILTPDIRPPVIPPYVDPGVRIVSPPKMIQQPVSTIPRVAVRPSPASHTVTQMNHGQWKVTEPLYGVEQTINKNTRPYFDSKHVSENTSMIKSSISAQMPPLQSHCIAQRNNIVNKITCDVNNVHNSYNNAITNASSNVVNSSANGCNAVIQCPSVQGKLTMPPINTAPLCRPMNRVLPMQAVMPKPEPIKPVQKPEIVIEEPTKPEIKANRPEEGAKIEEKPVVDRIVAVVKDMPDITDAVVIPVPEPVKLNTQVVETPREKEKLPEFTEEKVDISTPLKIVLQKQLEDGSYKITHNEIMKTPVVNKNAATLAVVEETPKQPPQITSLQLLPIKTFTLKANKAEDKSANLPKARPPPIAVKKPRFVAKPPANTPTAKKDPSVEKATKPAVTGPSLMYEIKSQDGFTHTASSMAEVWETVFQAVQNARKAHNLPPLAHNPLTEGLGLENNATIYLVEQLAGVNRCTKYKPKFHDLKPPKSRDIENDLFSGSVSGAVRAEPFRGRKVHDMFSWLASRHRQQPKMIAISETELRRAASTNLPMAMRFRVLKETSKESVGVYHSHIHGRGLFCLRDIEAGEMVIEYAGEVIRASLTDKREKYYDSKNIGCYMFKIDDHLVVDATMKGNAARFINHSCEPNCYSRVVDILGKKHILIFALRRIVQGEELTYDYKFPFEDIKIPCTCGSRRCRKYLN